MALKYSMILGVATGGSQGSGKRFGGLSESFFSGTPFTPDDIEIKQLFAQRATMMPNTTAIVGFRRTDTGAIGKSQVWRLNVSGTWDGQTQDQPKTCAIYQGAGSIGQVMKYTFRCVPDEVVVTGEGALAADWDKRAQPFFKSLEAFYQNARNLSAQSARIFTVSTLGAMITLDDFAVAPGTEVRVLRTRSPQNLKQIPGGVFPATQGTDAKHLTLAGWNLGDTVRGRVRVSSPVQNFYLAKNMRFVEISTRKVGKPFFSFVGRRQTAIRRNV